MQHERIEKLMREVSAWNCTVTEQEPLAKHTTFRIGGPARLFVEVRDVDALRKIRALCDQLEIPVFLLGKGSNLLVSDQGYDGAVLILSGEFVGCSRDGNRITAGAGTKLSTVATFAREEGLAGMECLYGIPGSVGGAVFMNAGAYGGEIKDVIREATCLMPDGSVQTVPAEELELSYRHSVFSENGAFVLSMTVELCPDDRAAIHARMEDFMERRRSKQPLEFPSAGSMFKRPVGYFAAALIEECGLKGFSVGGAQVSPKHSGFVVNTGGATCADVLELVRQVQKKVWDEKQVELECEVRRLGTFAE